MNAFICKPCDIAGDAAKLGAAHGVDWAKMSRARRLHAGCRGGTWCDCQHRGPNGEPA